MLRQIAAVTLLSLRSIPQRLGASIVVVIGLAAVVGVLVSVFTMAGSLTTSLISAIRHVHERSKRRRLERMRQW